MRVRANERRTTEGREEVLATVGQETVVLVTLVEDSVTVIFQEEKSNLRNLESLPNILNRIFPQTHPILPSFLKYSKLPPLN